MTDQSDRWSRIERLFFEAIELDRAGRAALLAERAQADAAVVAEVRELLAAHGGSGAFDQMAERMGSGAASASPDNPPDVPPGTRIGAYELIEEIGRGGMGAVYRARRADGQFEQEVALKLHRADLATGEVRRRFLAERQILARIAHPNIARLLDGGITDDGRSWFVMEHVDGLAIDRYCDEHRLDVARRLRLFLSVCEAVRYAHQNLVVHRDLKPGNILVTADGTVKLVDFGIAKLLDTGEAVEPSDVTRPGVRLLTPDCASPEQVLGEPITTASDVYQLGVLLFELLTGTRPFDLEGRSITELERVLTQTAPPRPSTVVSRPLRRRLAGDLDTIVSMALRREPERRYASVGHLAEDVERHLDGLPVKARRDTWWYRTSRFVRRNRVAVAALAAVFVLVAGFAVAMARQAGETRLALTRESRVTLFLIDLFRASSPEFALGDTVTVRGVLDRGAERVRAELADEPDVQAMLMQVIAQVYEHLELPDEALALRRDVLAIREGNRARDDPLVTRAVVQLAMLTARAGDPDEARPLLREAEERIQATRLPDSVRAVVLNNVGFGWQVLGDLDRAEPLLEAALALHRELDEPREDRVMTLTNLGNVRLARGDPDSAQRFLRESVAIRRTLYDPGHPQIAVSLVSLAEALRHAGSLAAADSAAEEAVRIRRAVYPDGHTQLDRVTYLRAGILFGRGELDAAEPLYREALAGYLAVHGEQAIPVALIRNDLAVVLKDQGRFADAEAMYRRALDGFEARFGAGHLNSAIVRGNLAWVVAQQDRYAEADRLYASAAAAHREARGRHPSLAQALLDWGTVRLDAGRPEGALVLLEEALDIFGASEGSGGYRVRARYELSRGLMELGRFEAAETHLRAVLQAVEGDTTLTAATTRRLTELYEAWGRPADARRGRESPGTGNPPGD